MGIPSFIAGAVAALLAVALLRRRRFFGRHWHWHGHRRWFLRSLYARLDTSPAQERVIEDELSQVLDALRAAKYSLSDLRSELAAAVRKDALSEEALQALSEKQEAAFQKVREAFRGGLSKIHQALDANQRERMAQLLERSRAFGRGHHRPGLA